MSQAEETPESDEQSVPERERLGAILRQFEERRMVVVGDLVADQFLFGEISRVSREAPVLILRHEKTETVPGGAANCALNLAALGARVSLFGVTGDDEAGAALVEKLSAAGVECDGVIRQPNSRTTTKVRILAGHSRATRQQVIRVDYEGETIADLNVHAELRRKLKEAAHESDALIISDYNYGVASEWVAKGVREAARARHLPVLVDSRFNLPLFPHFTSATPNEDEVEQLFGKPLTESSKLAEAGIALRERLGYEALLVTRGGRGMMLFERGREPTPHRGGRRARARGRDRRRRHCDCDLRALARFGRNVRGRRASRQSRGRSRRHETRHGLHQPRRTARIPAAVGGRKGTSDGGTEG